MIILINWAHIPAMFLMIFKDAFDFKAIFGGVSGSCMIYGIKRGLYSNEAVWGSAPNASAAIILFGAVIPMNAAWALADITMGGMTLINLPACMIIINNSKIPPK